MFSKDHISNCVKQNGCVLLPSLTGLKRGLPLQLRQGTVILLKPCLSSQSQTSNSSSATKVDRSALWCNILCQFSIRIKSSKSIGVFQQPAICCPPDESLHHEFAMVCTPGFQFIHVIYSHGVLDIVVGGYPAHTHTQAWFISTAEFKSRERARSATSSRL